MLSLIVRRCVPLALLFCEAVACDARRASLVRDSASGSVVPPASPSASAAGATDHSPDVRGDAPAPCTPAMLEVRALSAEAGAGQRALRVGFVKRDATPCTMQGYPSVALLDVGGREATSLNVLQSPGADRPPGSTPPAVLLSAGDTATFDIAWAVIEGEPEGCVDGTRFRVGPPLVAESDTVRFADVPLPAIVHACGARIRVTAVAGPPLERRARRSSATAAGSAR